MEGTGLQMIYGNFILIGCDSKGKHMMGRLHISLDDVKGIFKVLAKGSVNSIFETRTLAFLNKMHELYGTQVYLFCTYRDGNFSLEKVCEKYIEEFKNNQDWLKFGFHCYDENIIYNGDNLNDFQRQFDMFQKQIKRITGQRSDVDALRIHSFECNLLNCRYLREKGVKVLFTADDNRKSYYLNAIQMEQLKKKGYYYDENEDLMFVRSCTRLEINVDIISEIENYKNISNSMISVFTHEWQMDREDVRKRFELCCRWEGEMSG